MLKDKYLFVNARLLRFFWGWPSVWVRTEDMEKEKTTLLLTGFMLLLSSAIFYTKPLIPFIEFAANSLSSKDRCMSCSPEIFCHINDALGAALLVFALIFYSYYKFKNFRVTVKRFFNLIDSKYRSFLVLLISFFVVIIFLNALHRNFDHDEFEHVHSAWYIDNGKIPYTDFFQSHNSLFWYSLVPFLKFFGYTTKTLVALRIAMFLLTVSVFYVLYRIVRLVDTSRETALLSVLMLSTVVMFVNKSIEIRPDVPQLLFGFVSVYFFLVYLQTNKQIKLSYSGFFLGASFLFLQKAIFLILALGILLLIRLYKKQSRAWDLFLFALSLSIVVLPYYLYLYLTNSLWDYVLTNWLLNIKHVTSFSPLPNFWQSFIENSVFWSVSLLALFPALNSKNQGVKVLLYLGAFMLLSLFFVKAPNPQYFMLPIPFITIPASFVLGRYLSRHGIAVKLSILSLLVLVPAAFLLNEAFNPNFPNNKQQFEVVEFVYNNTSPADYVYDMGGTFNIYRRDLHYFWYSPRGLETYNLLTGKYRSYDVCALIKEKKPKIISDYRINLSECGLAGLYDATRYGSVYIRTQ